MVVRHHSGIPRQYLFQAAAALVATGFVIIAVREALVPDKAPSCEHRYPRATYFALETVSGEPLTTVDLQAKLAGRDWGLLENAAIVPTPGGPNRLSLQVDLKKDGRRPGTELENPGGIGFVWQQPMLEGVDRACLSYAVWLPEDFEFGVGGSLPGLFGGAYGERTSEGKRAFFSTQFRWRHDAKAEVRRLSPDEADGTGHVIDPGYFRLPRGSWVNLEQEIVLNTPGQSDGLLRVWIDSELRFERKGIAFRDSPQIGIAGITADVHYSGSDLKWAPAPKDTSLRLTPFLISLP